MKLFKNKNRKQALLSVILFIAVMAIYIEFNVLISKLEINDIDATENGIYSISQESKNLIKKIDKDVEINMIDFENYTNYSMVTDVMNLIEMYPKINDKIKITHTNTEVIDEKNQIYPKITIKANGKEHEITIDELFLYKYLPEASYNEEYYICEEVMTNLIVNLVKNDNKKVYLYKEKMIYGENYLLTLCSRIKNLGNDISYLSLSEISSVPEDCACIIIPPLSEDFSETEKNSIVSYIQNGGNILFLEESKSLTNIDTPNYDYIMSLYGFNIAEGVLLSQNNRLTESNPALIYANVNTNNNMLKTMDKKAKVSVIDAGVINIENQQKMDELGISYNTLVSSSEDSYLRKDMTNDNIGITENDEKMPNAVLGLNITKKVGDKYSNAIVFSNSLFITDRPIYVQDNLTGKNVAVSLSYLSDNEEIMAHSIKYLTNNTDSIIKRKKHYDSVPSIALMKDGITLELVFGLPLVVLFAGYIVWRNRKRKN